MITELSELVTFITIKSTRVYLIVLRYSQLNILGSNVSVSEVNSYNSQSLTHKLPVSKGWIK